MFGFKNILWIQSALGLLRGEEGLEVLNKIVDLVDQSDICSPNVPRGGAGGRVDHRCRTKS